MGKSTVLLRVAASEPVTRSTPVPTEQVPRVPFGEKGSGHGRFCHAIERWLGAMRWAATQEQQ